MSELGGAIFHAADLMAALSSIVVAIWVGDSVVKSRRDQREHNKLSVKPLVHLWTHHEDRSLTVRLENNGVGPAVIKCITLIKKGDNKNRSPFGDLENFLIDFRGDVFDIVSLNQIKLADSYSLPAGKAIDLVHLTLNEPNKNYLIKALFQNLESNVLFEVRYESIYGDEVIAINP